MTASAPTVHVERHSHVLLLRLDRPHVRNAIDGAMARELADALAVLESDTELRVGVLSGAGDVFCAGMDLKAFAHHGAPKGIDELLEKGSPKPLLAAVEGPAMGGGLELALMCDLLVAGASARFGLPEVRLGLFAAGGGLRRLPHRVPHGVACEMILTGRPIDAEAALHHGLVAAVTEDGGAEGRCLEIAAAIAANAPLAVQASKDLIAKAGLDDDAFKSAQRQHVRTVFRSADAREGNRAFAAKRPPVWTNS